MEPTYLLMSAVTPLVINDGSAWYSAWNRSGGLPPLLAASSLVTSASPCAGVLTVTWMLGFFWFQMATTLSTLVAQLQKVSFTGPLCWAADPDWPLDLEPPPEQAARSSTAPSKPDIALTRIFARMGRPPGLRACGGASVPREFTNSVSAHRIERTYSGVKTQEQLPRTRAMGYCERPQWHPRRRGGATWTWTHSVGAGAEGGWCSPHRCWRSR